LRWNSSRRWLKSARGAEFVHLHRVVDHQLGRHQRIDALRIAAQRLDGVAHGARSTMAGTPVKSCISTRAGM
jgi:hypothetical protein